MCELFVAVASLKLPCVTDAFIEMDAKRARAGAKGSARAGATGSTARPSGASHVVSSRDVFGNTDLVLAVLLQHARNTLSQGDCAAFFLVAGTCKLWRSAMTLADEHVAGWRTHTWKITETSKYLPHRLMPGSNGTIRYRSFSKDLTLSGAYDWQLRVWPKLRVLYNGADERDGETSDLDEPPVPVIVTAVQLCLPDATNMVPGWSRRAEWKVTLHHPTDERRSISKYFRLRFSNTTRCFPPDRYFYSSAVYNERPFDSLASFGQADELSAAGFVVGDAMRFSLRVRVHPGRLTCSSQADMADALLNPDTLGDASGASGSVDKVPGGMMHALLPAGSLTEHVRGVRNSDRCRIFWCDLCMENQPVSSLLRCSRGCNFDVCASCFRPGMHRMVERMCIGWAGRERVLQDHVEDHVE